LACGQPDPPRRLARLPVRLVFFTAVLTGRDVRGAVWLFSGGPRRLTARSARLTRWPARRPALLPVLTGGVWVLSEALRSRIPFGGFPWARVAFSQADAPTCAWPRLPVRPGVTSRRRGGGLSRWHGLAAVGPPAAAPGRSWKAAGAAAGASR